MPKLFVNTGNASASLIVPVEGDVVLDGKLYKNGDIEKDWDHAELISGVDFDVETPNTYQVIVNAMFKGEGKATPTCTVGTKTKTDPLAGDADDDGIDLEIGQFHIIT